MKRLVLLIACLMLVMTLGGCLVVGQKVNLGSATTGVSAVDGSAYYPLSVRVVENRYFVLTGEKEPSFIGKYRGGFGNPFDVNTEGNVPLAIQMERDLSTSLQRNGFSVVGDGAERNVKVSIDNYNFDCMLNCQVWHLLQVVIEDNEGNALHGHTVNIESVVDGNFFMGSKHYLEKELPVIYAKMLQDIVRNNPDAMAALQRKPLGES